jgi:hypothetical protein
LLFGRLAKGGVVRIDVNDTNELIFTYPEDDDGLNDAANGDKATEEPAA